MLIILASVFSYIERKLAKMLGKKLIHIEQNTHIDHYTYIVSKIVGISWQKKWLASLIKKCLFRSSLDQEWYDF